MLERTFLRTVGLGGMQSLARLALSFATIKFTAVYLGPSGLALVAQLQNFVALCYGMFGNSIATATARLYAEFRTDRARGHRFLATAWRLGYLFSLLFMVAIALGSGPLAQWLLKSEEYVAAVMVAGVAVLCLVLNAVILSAMNAVGEVGRVVLSNVIASVVGFAVYVPASVVWGIPGGLVGYAISATVCLPVSLAILRWSSSLAWKDFQGVLDRTEVRRIMSFMPMLIAHSVMPVLALILIRDMVAFQLSLETAGLWQATWRLSEVYLGVVMTSVSLYLMPRLGEVVGTPALRLEIIWTFVRTVGVTAAIAFAIFLFRDLIVRIVFTQEFFAVRDLMPFQLLGDVLKMAAWTFEVALVALVRSRWYIALQILIPATYLGGTMVLIPTFGAKGVTWAYCLAGAVHLAVSTFALRDVLFQKPDRRSDGYV